MQVADPSANAANSIALINEAASRQAAIVLFPELGLAGYTSDDLFHQRALLDGCLDALGQILETSETLPIVSVVGMPLVVDNLLFNCAIVIQHGLVLGVVPKTYLPNYREFYELRQFHPAHSALSTQIDLAGQSG